jgi:hypothetical protein
MLKRLLLTAALVLATVAGFAPPAHADVGGPYRVRCTVHHREVNFDIWIDFVSDTRFRVDRFNWDTRYPDGFTPSRLVLSLKAITGDRPVIRAWGGSASTLHDVATFDRYGPNLETITHRYDFYDGVYARVYLNEDEYCDSGLVYT